MGLELGSDFEVEEVCIELGEIERGRELDTGFELDVFLELVARELGIG